MSLSSRRMSSALFVLTLLLGIFVTSLPARAAIEGEGIELSDDAIALGEELAITYATENKSDTNWIGFYPAGQDPRDDGASSVWRYAPEEADTLTLNTASNEGWTVNSPLRPGDYEVYLLADDGYEPIGESAPVTIEEAPSTSSISLDTSEIDDGDELEITYATESDVPLEIGIYTRPQDVPGVVNVPDLRLDVDGPTGVVTWEGADDPAWEGDVSSLASGELHVALFEAGDYSRVLAGYESVAYSTDTEPEGTDEPIDLDVLALNIWLQGTSIPNGIEEIAKVIEETEAELVFLPEGHDGIAKVARELGYSFYDHRGTDPHGNTIDAGVISKYPIIEGASLEGNAWHKAVVDINGYEVAAYGGHLEYRYYVNYLPRGYGGGTPPPHETSEYDWNEMPEPITGVELILDHNEKSGRPAQAETLVADAQEEKGAGRLVIMGGDLNEPSHQDWVEETKDLFDHNGTVIPWQTTENLVNGGFVDAYREIFPNPVTHPGITWPSDNPQAETTELTWAPNADERDRIDYVFFMPDERLRLNDATVVGPKNSIVRNERVPEDGEDPIFEPEANWPTDHKAVLAQFTSGEQGAEPDPDPTPDPEPDPDPNPEPDPDPEPESDPDVDTEPDPETEPEAGADQEDMPETGAAGQLGPLAVAGLLLTAGGLIFTMRRTP